MQPASPPPPAPDQRISGSPTGPGVVQAGQSDAAPGARAVPRTAQELAGVREQRRWLSDQLVSAQERRRDVARALEAAHDPANQNGLQQRLQVLDRRILQLEGDMAETGRQLTSAPPGLAAARTAARPPDGLVLLGPDGPSTNVVPALLLLVIVLQLVNLARGRRARRLSVPVAPDAALGDAGRRLARLEQAVDAIAVEVERVSEGQRFVTRVLTEAPASGAPTDAARTADAARAPLG